MCMCVPIYLFAHHKQAGTHGVHKGVKSPGTRVADGGELPDFDAWTQTSLLYKSSIALHSQAISSVPN